MELIKDANNVNNSSSSSKSLSSSNQKHSNYNNRRTFNLKNYCALQIAKNIFTDIMSYEDIDVLSDDLRALIYFNLLLIKFKVEHPGGTPLIIACEEGELHHVELYVQFHYLNPDCKHLTAKEMINRVGKLSDGVKSTKSTWTALLTACENGHLDIVKYLHEHGGDLEICDGGGYSCLMAAVSNRHNKVVDYLLKQKVDITQSTKYGLTALHYAVINKCRNGIKMLLKADRIAEIINQKDSHGRTPLALASLSGYRDEIVELMRDQGILLTKKHSS